MREAMSGEYGGCCTDYFLLFSKYDTREHQYIIDEKIIFFLFIRTGHGVLAGF